MSENFVPKSQYDRVVELLDIIVQNEVCMSTPKKVISYLIDIGFTDEELVNLVNFSKDEIATAKAELKTDEDV